MSYKLGQQNSVQHVESGAWIPARWLVGVLTKLDPDSPFVRDFEAWLALGNTPTPADPPPPADAAAMDAAFQAGMTNTPPPSYAFDVQRAFIAKAISDEAYRLGVNPGALTGAQLAALRTRISNIYKAL